MPMPTITTKKLQDTIQFETINKKDGCNNTASKKNAAADKL